MQTGQSSRACLRREVPADHEAHSRPQRGQLRRNECRSHSRVVTTLTELWRDRDPEAEAVTRRSRAVAGSQAEQSLKTGAERRLRTDLRGKDSNDEAFPATYKSGPHVARRNPRPCRRQGGQPSSGQGQSTQALEPHGVWRGGERSSSARAKTQHASEHAERENTTWVST